MNRDALSLVSICILGATALLSLYFAYNMAYDAPESQLASLVVGFFSATAAGAVAGIVKVALRESVQQPKEPVQ